MAGACPPPAVSNADLRKPISLSLITHRHFAWRLVSVLALKCSGEHPCIAAHQLPGENRHCQTQTAQNCDHHYRWSFSISGVNLMAGDRNAHLPVLPSQTTDSFGTQPPTPHIAAYTPHSTYTSRQPPIPFHSRLHLPTAAYTPHSRLYPHTTSYTPYICLHSTQPSITPYIYLHPTKLSIPPHSHLHPT